MSVQFSFDSLILDQLMVAARRPFLVCDQDGRFLYVDAAAREILDAGTPNGECKTIHELPFDPQARDRLTVALSHVFHEGVAGSGLGQMSVNPRHVLRPVRDAAGRVCCAVLEFVEDGAAPELICPEDANRYRKLVEASPQGIIVHRNDQVLFANRAAAGVLGYGTPEEIQRLDSIDVYVHPDDRASTRAYRASRGRGEWAPDDYDFRAIRKDGSTVWINCRPTIVDWDGAPAFQVTFFDVTERKRAMDAMIRADRRFRELLEQAAVGILVRRGDRTVFANRALARMFGHDHPQDVVDVGIVGLQEAELGRERAPARPESTPHANQRAQTYFEFEGRRQDGGRVWLGCWRQPATWDDEPALLSILIDISERKRLEEELRRAHRMDAVGRFAGGLAHEVNNILAVVLGHLDVTQQALNEGDASDTYLQKAIRAVRHGTVLAQRILAMSKPDHHPVQAVDINQTADFLVDLLPGLLGPSIEVATELADDLWPVKTDIYDAEAALLNIALNSRDAMADGGRLTLSTRNVAVGSADASRHENVASGDYVLISVADNGSGMSQDVAARAFEPFFTTKPPGKGTGLGLGMVHGFVSRAGGFAEIHSEPGQGTRIDLYLPRAGD